MKIYTDETWSMVVNYLANKKSPVSVQNIAESLEIPKAEVKAILASNPVFEKEECWAVNKEVLAQVFS